MALRDTSKEYIQKIKFIIGETAIGIEDESIQVALDSDRRYFYRIPLIPKNTTQLWEPTRLTHPEWYEYYNYTVYEAPYKHWEPNNEDGTFNVSFIDFEGDAITPSSFDYRTGLITLSSAVHDLRITGYCYAIYSSALRVVTRAMGDKTSYYQYSNDGGEQNEAQWYLNLQRLYRDLSEQIEVF